MTKRKMSRAQQRAMFAKQNQTYTLAQLRERHAKRSLGAKVLDNTQGHRHTITHRDPGVKGWIRSPGSADIVGVDDPDAEYRAARGRKSATGPMRVLADPDTEIRVLKRDKQAGRRVLPPRHALAQKRAQKSLKAAIQTNEAEIKRLKAERSGSKELDTRRLLLERQRRILRAYENDELLVLGSKKDRRTLDLQAKVLKERFDLDPRTMESRVIFVGNTHDPGVYGFTHEWNVQEGVPADYIALNPRQFGTGGKEDPRDTLTHEAVHVMRKREAGRTKPETRGVADYGRDRDIEEKYTVLEEQVRSAPRGTKRGVSYYGALRDDQVPLHVGAADNRTARAAKAAKREKRLARVQEGMHKRGHKTHVARIHRDRSTGRWGTIPPEQEGIDRVFTTRDGDSVHVYNPRGAKPRNPQALADRVDGRRDDNGVYEYRDGQR